MLHVERLQGNAASHTEDASAASHTERANAKRNAMLHVERSELASRLGGRDQRDCRGHDLPGSHSFPHRLGPTAMRSTA
eukprot:7769449-Alexandrium_andersonii.AAC.1